MRFSALLGPAILLPLLAMSREAFAADAPPADDAETTHAHAQAQAPGLAHGGYSAPELRLTTLAGEPAALAGAQAGWILGHTLVLGAAGYGSITSAPSPASLRPVTGDDAYLTIGYGGLRVGAIAYSMRKVHLTGGLLLGGGGATAATSDGSYRQSAGFFVVEPDLAFETNLDRHVRFALGGGFRFVVTDQRPGFTTSRLSGPAISFTLRFGQF